MDLQAQVAARRAQLADQAQTAKAIEAKATAARQADERAARTQTLEAIAESVSACGTPVHAAGERLEISHPATAPIDIEALTRSKLVQLFKREIRKSWSPTENWVVIGSLVAGACTIFYGVGFILILFGLWMMGRLHKKYRTILIAHYPTLFGEFADLAAPGSKFL